VVFASASLASPESEELSPESSEPESPESPESPKSAESPLPESAGVTLVSAFVELESPVMLESGTVESIIEASVPGVDGELLDEQADRRPEVSKHARAAPAEYASRARS
jgi:hypothetical protein